ncbi:zinc-dependent alcohol dehydrogenase [Haloactinomyces albus]|uniref:2-desacetyl-2-hydroxyethyl bacteriochlorophyllide A dehydrogenase n=1 Tax=Haloactinomyces albus TaxID=1352928 RepID=A0AAE3ZHQ3_9ACTN|nr:alcohol dehydrogenase catalytic domain-containing protein [Haloactinomyces albus]MDR7304126.1 2-desacetyl-2-hydroxyethyl bacteriochlorophyllide A dehydrogenase [Haloactinomyces albus]
MTGRGAPRAVLIDEPGKLRVVPDEPSAPGPGEALIEVAWSGICGSDREVFTGGRPEGFVRYPVIPGHEWSGTVAEVGAGVPAEIIGKPVVGEGFRSCRACAACRRGDNNLCAADYDETGFTRPGAWANHLTLPAHLLHVLPEAADLRKAAALEPAACTAAATLKLATVPGERVAVVGGGSLGLLATQLLAAVSPAELTLVHTRRDRADLAAACGATSLITSEEAEQHLGRYDAVLEAAGATGTADLATRLTRPGGRVALTGVPPHDRQPPSPAHLVVSQITVHTVFGAPPRAWTQAVRAFTSGVLDPGLIISRELELDEAPEALRLLDEERDKIVKILLHP